MSGYLKNLRANWQRNCMNQGNIPALDFMVKYGATAKFLHIGADGHREGAKKVYGFHLYALFALTNGSKIPCTIEDMAQMADYETHIKVTPAARENMLKQLNMAVKEFEAHKAKWGQMPLAKTVLGSIIPLQSAGEIPYNRPH